jgi:outer membrane lipoprotein-sorting protein
VGKEPARIPALQKNWGGFVLIRMKWKIVVLMVGFAFLDLASAAGAAEIRDGAGLLRAMQERYAKDWYETLHFKEKAITHNAGGTDKTEVWDEAAILPGKLRIDIGPADNAGMEGSRGMLVTDNTLTLFKDGVVTSTQPFVHMLLVLGFDIYRQPAETTIAQVKAQGFDLSKIHEDVWDGQAVYVVGADKGDLKAKQFWIEKKRLLFVRLIEQDDRDKKLHDTRFSDYRKLGVGWVAARVEFYVDGKNTLSEEYFDMQANPKLDAAKFDAKNLKR